MPTSTLSKRLSDVIRDHYVFPDVAATIADHVETITPDGTPEQVSAFLTECVQSLNNDRHLRVRQRAAGALESPSDWDAHYGADAVRNAGGMRRVERLDQRTGLLVIDPYLSPVHHAERYVTAAFTLLAGVDRLVIDLRAGRGGTPETVALICGYLLGNEPVHLQDIVDRAGDVRQYWTSPAAGRLAESVDICVLTSELTFSACEELAYNLQAQRRATIIGRRTRGGAHPVEVFPLTDQLEVTVPIARSVNTVTATNWEQTGVIPDVDCDPEESLEQARRISTASTWRQPA